MVRVACALLVALAGCDTADPCAPFPDESCIALEVRGAGVRDLDQLRLSASGFLLRDGVSPDPPRGFTLPVQLAVVPGGRFIGAFDLSVRGFLDGDLRGTDEVRGALGAGQHLRLVATLAPDGAADLGVDDLADADLSSRPPDLATVDLAGRDLAFPKGWSVQSIPDTAWLYTIWGTGSDNLYAAGLNGVIVHSTGDDVWTRQGTGRSFEIFNLGGSGPGDLYAVEEHALLHSSGNGNWTIVNNIPPENFSSLRNVIAFSTTLVYLGGSTGQSVPANLTGGTNLFMWNGSALDPQFAQATHTIFGMWATGPDDLWAVGTPRLVLRSTGDGNWTQQNFAPDGTLFQGQLTGVWASSKTNVYACARGIGGGIFHSTGNGTWTRQPGTPTNINGIWGSGPTDLWAVGDEMPGAGTDGFVLRSSGDGQWRRDPDYATFEDGRPLRAVFGTRFGDVYVVGYGASIGHKRE